MQTSLVISVTVVCIGLSIAADYPVYRPNTGGTEYIIGSTSGFTHHQYPPSYVTVNNKNQQSHYYQPHQQQQAQTTQQQYPFHQISSQQLQLSQAPHQRHPIQDISLQQQTQAPHQQQQVQEEWPQYQQQAQASQQRQQPSKALQYQQQQQPSQASQQTQQQSQASLQTEQQAHAPQQRDPTQDLTPPQTHTQTAQQRFPVKETNPQTQKHDPDDPSTDERLEGVLPFGNYEVGFDAGPGFDSELYGIPGGSPPPYGYPDPSFATQAGFEGLLVPNTWYGLLPWGIEGVIIVIAGIIVFAIIVIAIIGLLLWLCGIRAVMPWVIKRDADGIGLELRSRQSDQWSIVNLSVDVLDAIEKFNEVSLQDEMEDKKQV